MLPEILIIEDDADIAESLQYNFKREGFRSSVAESGEKGLRLALDEKNPPALIILDLMLPGMSGMELCRRLRREPLTEKTPIIMLTAKAAEIDKIAGLELGADDYIVKPFSVKEVVARVRAVLRRVEKETIERYEDEKISIDFADMRVLCRGADVKLTRKEFALLTYLIKSAGRVATRQNLLDNVWGYSYFGDTRTLDVHIRRLRQKLGDCGDCIETVVGVGYRFIEQKIKLTIFAAFMNFLDNWFGNKKAGESLSRPILGKILGAMRESIIVVGEDTRIISSNQAAYNAFARKNGALENKRLSEVIRDRALHEAFRKALEENESSDIELEIPSFENRKYDVRVAPVQLDQDGAAIGIFYDITQIERLETVRQEFLSNISHELRTPLTSILAFVETLEDGAIDDAENNQHFLAVIRKNARRMHHLIDDILELSSIESGKIAIELKPVNLFAAVEEVFTNLSTKARERRVKLTNKVSDITFVFADVVRLEQMLTNLIDNAVKFNSADGSVIVSSSLNDSKDVISVADTGEGISSEHLQRIFERFYRTDRARSREIGGTGLGLAIVKHLARLHGGEVFVASALGKGSVFSIELPREN